MVASRAARLRKEKRKDRLVLLGVVLLMLAALGAYLFYAQDYLRSHRGHHHHSKQK